MILNYLVPDSHCHLVVRVLERQEDTQQVDGQSTDRLPSHKTLLFFPRQSIGLLQVVGHHSFDLCAPLLWKEYFPCDFFTLFFYTCRWGQNLFVFLKKRKEKKRRLSKFNFPPLFNIEIIYLMLYAIWPCMRIYQCPWILNAGQHLWAFYNTSPHRIAPAARGDKISFLWSCPALNMSPEDILKKLLYSLV